MGEWNPPIPWRQGNFLTADAMASLKLVPGFDRALHVGVVVSHDCDIARRPDAEPAVEVIVGCRVNWDRKKYGNYTHSKNPRRLVLPAKEAGTDVGIDLKATEKRSVLKAALGSHAPHETLLLDPAGVITLQHWLAFRYLRSGFPDAFNEFLTKTTKAGSHLEEILERRGHHILRVFFKVVERKEPEDPPFTLSIRLLYSTAEDFDAAEAEANFAARDITSAFRL